MGFNNSNQLKSYLLKESKEREISINNIYNTFFSRRLLEILSKYTYGQILVKGSFSQFVHLGGLTRPITDIDFVSPGDYESAKAILNDSFNYTRGQIDFSIDNNYKQTKTGIYQLSATASFGSIKHPIGIDLKCCNDCIFETNYKLVKPIFEEDQPYYINTPSYEEHLAEKLCIIVESCKTDRLNTRMKDFYDIYQLHGGKYDYDKLSIYFYKMLEKRGKINLEDATTEHLGGEFIKRHQKEWEISKNKFEFLDKDISLASAVGYSRAVLREQLFKMKTLNKKSIHY